MPESIFADFPSLLKPEGPVAIVIKQTLVPVNEDDPIIFPPSYPITAMKGRVHTVQDGEYRVSVELPANAKREKQGKDSEQTSGYNIDRFPDGTNSCEIDSPQSQANRIEPIFKRKNYSALVPQIEIAVGDGATRAKVNLLDVGHRAGDAVVRLSSLADKFHTAFMDAKGGNHLTLATIAPTSLLFGVWDSRSTQVKLQRILKASIRASNVRECTRSAQFTPAIDYVAVGAVDAVLDKDESDKNVLSTEGMKHALAVQKVGGVMLTSKTSLTRTVTVNLVALRALKADSPERTGALQRYVLGLAIVAATVDPDLNLREGCHLRFRDELDAPRLVPRRGEARPISLDPEEVVSFARDAARAFFVATPIPFDNKDHLDAVFEAGVAEEFLALKGDDRDEVRRRGAITAATLKGFYASNNDPFKPLLEAVKAAQITLGSKPKKGQPAVQSPEALGPVSIELTRISESTVLSEEARKVASELVPIVERDQDSQATLRFIDEKIKKFKKTNKEALNSGSVGSEEVPSE